MIIKLTPEQIADYWSMIKHGVVIANRLRVDKVEETTNKLLERLLIGKAQCWLGYNIKNGEREFSAFGLTTIEESSIGEVYLFLHTLYGFRLISPELLEEIVPKLEVFAHDSGCSKMVTLTANKRLQEYYTSQGFAQDPMVFVKEL